MFLSFFGILLFFCLPEFGVMVVVLLPLFVFVLIVVGVGCFVVLLFVVWATKTNKK